MKRIKFILIVLLICANGYGQKLDVFSERIKNKLIPYEEQVNMYRKKLNTKASTIVFDGIQRSKIGAFEVKLPYVIVTVEDEKIKDLKYLEGNINEQTIDQVKMVIFKYDKLDENSSYYVSDSNKKKSTIAGTRLSFGAILIYFDMDKKECVGHDVVAGPPLPDTYISTELGGNFFVGMDEIIKRIEVRLLPLKLAYQEENPYRLEGTWSGKSVMDNWKYLVHYTFKGKKLKYEWDVTKKRSIVYEGSVIYNENIISFTPEKVIFHGKEKKLYVTDAIILFYTLTDNMLIIHTYEGFGTPGKGCFHKKETD